MVVHKVKCWFFAAEFCLNQSQSVAQNQSRSVALNQPTTLQSAVFPWYGVEMVGKLIPNCHTVGSTVHLCMRVCRSWHVLDAAEVGRSLAYPQPRHVGCCWCGAVVMDCRRTVLARACNAGGAAITLVPSAAELLSPPLPRAAACLGVPSPPSSAGLSSRLGWVHRRRAPTGLQVFFENANHWLYLEEPDKFNKRECC